MRWLNNRYARILTGTELGDRLISGGDNNLVYGDQGLVTGRTTGFFGSSDTLNGSFGDDLLIGDVGRISLLADSVRTGSTDAFASTGNIAGGNDTFDSENNDDILIGDGAFARTHATADAEAGDATADAGDIYGGDDDIHGWGGEDVLIGDYIFATSSASATSSSGDATASSGDIICGDDFLKGYGGNDFLIGDMVSASTSADADGATDSATSGRIICGDDFIKGGPGDDQMWGDTVDGSGVGGDDVFSFKAGAGGTDIIWDFEGAGEAGGDVIRLFDYNSYSISTFTDLTTINGVSYSSPLSGSILTATDQTIYVIGATELDSGDVLLV